MKFNNKNWKDLSLQEKCLFVGFLFLIMADIMLLSLLGIFCIKIIELCIVSPTLEVFFKNVFGLILALILGIIFFKYNHVIIKRKKD